MHFLHLFQWCTKMWSWSRKMKDYEITFARLQHVTFWLLGQLMPNFFRRLNSGSCCRLPTKREKSGNYHYGFYRKDCKPLNTEIGSKSLCTPSELRTADSYRIIQGCTELRLKGDWVEIFCCPIDIIIGWLQCYVFVVAAAAGKSSQRSWSVVFY